MVQSSVRASRSTPTIGNPAGLVRYLYSTGPNIDHGGVGDAVAVACGQTMAAKGPTIPTAATPSNHQSPRGRSSHQRISHQSLSHSSHE